MTWHYEIKEYYDYADAIEGARRKRGQIFTLATAKDYETKPPRCIIVTG